MYMFLALNGNIWGIAILVLLFLLLLLVVFGGIHLNSLSRKARQKSEKDSKLLLSIIKRISSDSMAEISDVSDLVGGMLQKGTAVPVNVRNNLLEIDKRLEVAKGRIKSEMEQCEKLSESHQLDFSSLDLKELLGAGVQDPDRTEAPAEENEPQTQNKPATDASFMDRFNSIVERNISNTELSVAFIASEMCVSRSGLFAKVKEATGDTPNNIISNVRLSTAAKLLDEKAHPINEICYMVGFSSPSYFSRCFDKRYGMTPHEWMNRTRK